MWMEKLTHLDTGEKNNRLLLEPRELKNEASWPKPSPLSPSGAHMQVPGSQELPQQPFDSYVTFPNVDSTLEFLKTCNSFSVNFAENGSI